MLVTNILKLKKSLKRKNIMIYFAFLMGTYDSHIQLKKAERSSPGVKNTPGEDLSLKRLVIFCRSLTEDRVRLHDMPDSQGIS